MRRIVGRQRCLTARHRRGVAIFYAVACVMLAMLLVSTLTKTVLLQRRQTVQAGHRIQAELLAESALERASHQLLKSDDYTGESWQPQIRTGQNPVESAVTIQVQRLESGEQRIEVVADVPSDPHWRQRVRKERVVATRQEQQP